jgi:hypothetical protein
MCADLIDSHEGACASSQSEQVGVLSCASLIQALENTAREAAPGVTMVEELSYLQAQLLAAGHRLRTRNVAINFQVCILTISVAISVRIGCQ